MHIGLYSTCWQKSRLKSGELSGFPKLISLAYGKSKSNVLPSCLADLDFSQNDCQPRCFLVTPKSKHPISEYLKSFPDLLFVYLFLLRGLSLFHSQFCSLYIKHVFSDYMNLINAVKI